MSTPATVCSTLPATPVRRWRPATARCWSCCTDRRRISEAVGLAVDDIDLAGQSVLLLGKGGKQRRVPLGSYAARALDAYLVQVGPALVALGPARRRCSTTLVAARCRGSRPGRC